LLLTSLVVIGAIGVGIGLGELAFWFERKIGRRR